MKNGKTYTMKFSDVNELLKEFLPANELVKFRKTVRVSGSEKLKVTKPRRGVILPEVNFDNMENRYLIDAFSTFIEDKVPIEKFYDLLFRLAKLSISKGDFDFALDVSDLLIKINKKNSKFSDYAANAYLLKGDILSRQAKWSVSMHNIQKAKKIFAASHDNKNVSICENLLGTIFAEQGKIKNAKEHFEAGLSLVNAKTDKYTVSMIEVNLGILYNINGQFDEAFSYFYRALLTFEDLNDLRRTAEVRHNLGTMLAQKGDYLASLKEFDRSLKIAVNQRFLPILAITLLGKAFVYTQIDDLQLAMSFADRGMEISLNLNDRLSIADGYKIKGIIKRKQKKYDSAENFLLTSKRINEEYNNKVNIAETCFELGLLYQARRNPEKANLYFNEALSYYKTINYKSEVAKIKKFLQ